MYGPLFVHRDYPGYDMVPQGLPNVTDPLDCAARCMMTLVSHVMVILVSHGGAV